MLGKHFITLTLLALCHVVFAQSCPDQLEFYKITGGGSNLCVEFDSNPGVSSILHNGFTLNQVGSSNRYATASGNCSGNSPPTTEHTFTIGMLTCFYTSSGSLPVRLISFEHSIHTQGVLLQWATASEIDNELFVVERQHSSGNFEEIGFVEGAGNSYEVNSYRFTDRIPVHGTNYYRLKQIDVDGTYQYSDIVSARWKTTTKMNLRNNLLTLRYPGNARWVLLDLSGKVVKQHDFNGYYEIDLSALRGSGIFISSIISSTENITQKFTF